MALTRPSLVYPKADIKIKSVPGGLSISQHSVTYLARRWQLTSEVCTIVETALEFGLTHLWQENHPSGPESHHISFSLSHDPGSWVFVLGKEALPPNVRCVTFHKRLKEYLKAAGLGQWENAGGKNILVRPQDLRGALSCLPLDGMEAGGLPRLSTAGTFDRAGTYLSSEQQLEDTLYSAYFHHPAVKAVYRQQSFAPNYPHEVASRTDLILDLSDRIVVAELKVGNSGEPDVAQVCRYRANAALARAYSGKLIYGALIAANFQQDAMTAARDTSISLYTYDEQDGMRLTLICGNDVLPGLSHLRRKSVASAM